MSTQFSNGETHFQLGCDKWITNTTSRGLPLLLLFYSFASGFIKYDNKQEPKYQ